MSYLDRKLHKIILTNKQNKDVPSIISNVEVGLLFMKLSSTKSSSHHVDNLYSMLCQIVQCAIMQHGCIIVHGTIGNIMQQHSFCISTMFLKCNMTQYDNLYQWYIFDMNNNSDDWWKFVMLHVFTWLIYIWAYVTHITSYHIPASCSFASNP